MNDRTDAKQLLFFARHYLGLAKRLESRCNDKRFETIGDLFDDFPRAKSHPIYLLLAHLASASFRIATIVEMYKLESFDYRELVKKMKGTRPDEIELELRNALNLYLPMMLRDQVGHVTQGSGHSCAEPRNNVLLSLTPSDCLELLERAITAITRTLGR